MLTCADKVSERREVGEAFDKAPHIPIAGDCAVAMFNEELQADLPFLRNVFALCAMDVFPQYSLSALARPRTPQKAWGALCNSRLGVFGPPQCIQIDGGGRGGNDLWEDLRLGRVVKLPF